MPDPTLDMLSQFARPGTPLWRILNRRLSGAGNSGYLAPGAYPGTNRTGSPIRSGAFQGGPMNPASDTTGSYGTPSMGSATAPVRGTAYPRSQRYTGMGSVGGGGSNMGVMRGDFQMGGYPAGGGLHLSPTTNLNPDLRFGRAVSTVNGYDLNHPSIPGMINSATRLRGVSRADNVGMRGPY